MTTTIPGVREQVASWSGRPAKDDDHPRRETIDAKDLRIVGTVGRSTFALAPDGRELRLRGPVRPHRIEESDASVILVGKLVRSADGKVRTDAFLAQSVEPGTFAKLSKRKSYSPRERPPSPIDRDHELREGFPREPVELGKDDGSPEAVIKGSMSRAPSLLITNGRPPMRSVADEIAFLQHSGVTLALSDDGAYLLVTSPKGLSAVVRGMLDNRAALYRGHLAGKPARCAWPHPSGKAPDAVTIAVGNSPVCAAHLAGIPSDAA